MRTNLSTDPVAIMYSLYLDQSTVIISSAWAWGTDTTALPGAAQDHTCEKLSLEKSTKQREPHLPFVSNTRSIRSPATVHSTVAERGFHLAS